MAFGLTSLVKVNALRRFVAVACAFAFLTVSFVHLTHNPDLAKNGIAVAVEMSALPDGNDEPDASKQKASLDHCDGCMLVATVVANLIVFAHAKPELPGLRLLPMQAILHTAESPPPRA